MITPFWGEFGLISTPMDLSHNYCSTKCAYCFANLNNPNRTAKTKEFANQIKNYKKNKNFTALMMQNKMLVNISNRTDPFALSNYKVAIPQMELLNAEQIPFTIMTRGGVGIDDVLGFVDNQMVWYISITHTDDITRKLVEPGGSTIESRWELVDKLKAAGHKVVVACNPFFSKWVDPLEFMKKMEIHRPDGFTVQGLHLNYKQIANMSEKEKVNVGGEDTFAYARKRTVADSEYVLMRDMSEQALRLGCRVLNYHTPELVNNQDQLYREVYGADRVFNTIFQFVDWCRRTKKRNDPVYFKEYANFMLKNNPFRKGSYNVKSYLTSQSKAFREGVNLPGKMRLLDILSIMWNTAAARKQINNLACFAALVDYNESKEEVVFLTDEHDNLIFVWSRELHPR